MSVNENTLFFPGQHIRHTTDGRGMERAEKGRCRLMGGKAKPPTHLPSLADERT